MAERVRRAREDLHAELARPARGAGVAGRGELPARFERPRASASARALLARGLAVRPGATFPGLGPEYLRVTVREPEANLRLAAALAEALAAPSPRLAGALG